MDFRFNVNAHLVGYYATLPAANDGLVFIPLAATGLASDAVLKDLDTLTQVLANATEHPMGRKVSTTSPAVNVDDTNDRVDIGAGYANLTWTAPASTGGTVGKLLCCYDPDTTAGTDADLKLLWAWDFLKSDGTAVTPDGIADVQATVNAAGLARVS